MTETHEWSPKWPVEPGYYWAYFPGRASRRRRSVRLLEVWKLANGTAWVCDGTFVYPSERGSQGAMFMPAQVPEPPTVEEEKP